MESYLNQGFLLLTQNIVLIITAGILVWYTIETRLLRKAQQWPLVIVKALEDHSFVVENVGNSPALNIWVGGYRIRVEATLQKNYGAGDQLRSSNAILYLAPGNSVQLRADRFTREQTQSQQSHTWGQVYLPDPLVITILRVGYQNLAMRSFYAEQIIHTGSIKLLWSGKVTRIFRRASQNFLKVLVSNGGQIKCVQLTQRGERQLIKPLRP